MRSYIVLNQIVSSVEEVITINLSSVKAEKSIQQYKCATQEKLHSNSSDELIITGRKFLPVIIN